MTKFLLAAVIIVGLVLGAFQLYKFWGHYQGSDNSQQPAAYTPPHSSIWRGTSSRCERTSAGTTRSTN